MISCLTIKNFLHSLFAGPKDGASHNILSSTQAYKNVMKNNVDLELSFNSWDISIQRTLNTTKSAIISNSGFLDWGRFYSNHGEYFSCLVRIKIMIKC